MAKVSPEKSMTTPTNTGRNRKRRSGIVYSQNSKRRLSTSVIFTDFVKKKSKFVIYPNNWFKEAWDVALIFVVLYTLGVVSLEFGLVSSKANEPHPESYINFTRGFQLFAYFLDVVFIVDIVLVFMTAYKDEKGQYVTDLSKIGKNYMSSDKTMFITDIIACFPLELIFLILNRSSTTSYNNAIKLLKLPRLMRVSRLMKFFENFKHANLWRVFRLYVYVIIVMHMCSCTLAYLADQDGSNWFFVELGQDFPPAQDKYAACLFTTVQSLFGGRVEPTTNSERYYFSVVRLVGAAVQATIFGNIAMLLANSNALSLKWRQHMDRVNESMRHMQIPRDIQERVRQYYEFSWVAHGGVLDTRQWMSDLSMSLKSQVLVALNHDMIQKVHLFRDCDPDFIVGLIQCLQPILFLPGDTIVKEGKQGKEMYFVVQGVVEIIQDGKYVKTVPEGSFFGEIALVTPKAIRTATIKARTHVELNMLHKDDFEQLLHNFPHDASLIYEVAAQRQKYKLAEDGILLAKAEKQHKATKRAWRRHSMQSQQDEGENVHAQFDHFRAMAKLPSTIAPSGPTTLPSHLPSNLASDNASRGSNVQNLIALGVNPADLQKLVSLGGGTTDPTDQSDQSDDPNQVLSESFHSQNDDVDANEPSTQFSNNIPVETKSLKHLASISSGSFSCSTAGVSLGQLKRKPVIDDKGNAIANKRQTISRKEQNNNTTMNDGTVLSSRNKRQHRHSGIVINEVSAEAQQHINRVNLANKYRASSASMSEASASEDKDGTLSQIYPNNLGFTFSPLGNLQTASLAQAPASRSSESPMNNNASQPTYMLSEEQLRQQQLQQHQLQQHQQLFNAGVPTNVNVNMLPSGNVANVTRQLLMMVSNNNTQFVPLGNYGPNNIHGFGPNPMAAISPDSNTSVTPVSHNPVSTPVLVSGIRADGTPIQRRSNIASTIRPRSNSDNLVSNISPLNQSTHIAQASDRFNNPPVHQFGNSHISGRSSSATTTATLHTNTNAAAFNPMQPGIAFNPMTHGSMLGSSFSNNISYNTINHTTTTSNHMNEESLDMESQHESINRALSRIEGQMQLFAGQTAEAVAKLTKQVDEMSSHLSSRTSKDEE
eukprot:TRINITY_DN4181_c0_g1_i1.p1 TRINITY_DN4181_c0_g1~~TRINITY_DN4181_c0_g1_i1.p1  ORF type:complete len:1155 (-),score=315.82 TRINITY_DN4181_c0_g1_i1:307-3627(-)